MINYVKFSILAVLFAAILIQTYSMPSRSGHSSNNRQAHHVSAGGPSRHSRQLHAVSYEETARISRAIIQIKDIVLALLASRKAISQLQTCMVDIDTIDIADNRTNSQNKLSEGIKKIPPHASYTSRLDAVNRFIMFEMPELHDAVMQPYRQMFFVSKNTSAELDQTTIGIPSQLQLQLKDTLVNTANAYKAAIDVQIKSLNEIICPDASANIAISQLCKLLHAQKRLPALAGTCISLYGRLRFDEISMKEDIKTKEVVAVELYNSCYDDLHCDVLREQVCQHIQRSKLHRGQKQNFVQQENDMLQQYFKLNRRITKFCQYVAGNPTP